MATKEIIASSPCSMSSLIPTPLPIFLKKIPCPSGGSISRRVVCSASAQLKHATDEKPIVERRSGNYQPSVWDYGLLLSSTSVYQGEEHMKKVELLKCDVKSIFKGEKNTLKKLELIDSVQRLGLEYHFKKEITAAIDSLYFHDAQHPSWTDADFYTVALKFRLFRQKGLLVPEDVFQKFIDNGAIKEDFREDVKTLLTLYDASFLAYEDENIINKTREYATESLTRLVSSSVLSEAWDTKVNRALDVPLHWRLNRLEARWFIDIYEQEHDMNQSLLELAKLDFNILQSTYLQEVQELTRWWLDMGLNKITFSRDRILEHYLWCALMVHEPKFGTYRIGLTKITSMISLIDDVYDVYGSPEELELTTEIMNRWDISRVDELPPPVRTVVLAIFNTSNELGYMTHIEQGFNTIPYIGKSWANLCNAYLKESKWYNGGHIPTMEQYMENSVISIGGALMLIVTYILTSDNITENALKYIEEFPSVVRCSCMILRLTNDLGTSKDELARGDNMKSIQCYMNENEVEEEVAREHVKDLIEKTWKIMNKNLTDGHPFSEPALIGACQNLARAAQYFYRNGDGHGVTPDIGTKDRLECLILEPVPI